jgi:hypothetical protein
MQLCVNNRWLQFGTETNMFFLHWRLKIEDEELFDCLLLSQVVKMHYYIEGIIRQFTHYDL